LRHRVLKWLITGHRWLGIATCVLFALWFASGLVMMYVGFPALSREERFARLERIEWNAVKITPEHVLHGLGLGEFPRELRLEMSAGEPVYRVLPVVGPQQAISATDGRIVEAISATQALTIARHAAPGTQPTATTVDSDQWTVAGSFAAHRPMYRVALHDAAGTELYISSSTGEVVLDTTRRERLWNWVGAVLHWIYFHDLRANPPLWSQVVLWASGIGIVVALTGLWLGIDRLRLRRRYRNSSITPYRGWMAWHHVAGLVGGVFLLTWIFSGWLSMGPPVPWRSDSDPRRMRAAAAEYAGNSEANFATSLDVLRSFAGRDVREASFTWALGEPQIALSDAARRVTVVDAATGAPRLLPEAELIAAAQLLMPDARLIATERLTREDTYWYTRRDPRPLPVLRFIFDDEERTWVHVDPRTGRVVGWLRSGDRVHRWVFNAFHSLDFRWLLLHRPAWDIVMWLASAAGLAISISSVVIGWRRLRA
jgi:hypothetical protein